MGQCKGQSTIWRPYLYTVIACSQSNNVISSQRLAGVLAVNAMENLTSWC